MNLMENMKQRLNEIGRIFKDIDENAVKKNAAKFGEFYMHRTHFAAVFNGFS